LSTEISPIPAASVLILRDPLEVLMILRHEKSSFVPGAWVFPGGAVDAADGAAGSQDALRRAALREVLEETGVSLESDLVLTSRWITPKGMPKRFDTWFYLASAPSDLVITLEQKEAVEFRWVTPAEALKRQTSGEFPMVFPTIRNLEALLPFRSATEAIDARRNAVIEPVEPVLVIEDGRKRIRLP